MRLNIVLAEIHIEVFSTNRPILIDRPSEAGAHRIPEPNGMLLEAGLLTRKDIDRMHLVVDIPASEADYSINQHPIKSPAQLDTYRALDIDVVTGVHVTI